MEIEYQTNKLKKTARDYRAISKQYGAMAKKVIQRLQEFKAANSLEDIRKLPGARCHELSPKSDRLLAVDVTVNHRIIFTPHHDPMPVKEDGGLDWPSVTKITIVAIGEDYH